MGGEGDSRDGRGVASRERRGSSRRGFLGAAGVGAAAVFAAPVLGSRRAGNGQHAGSVVRQQQDGADGQAGQDGQDGDGGQDGDDGRNGQDGTFPGPMTVDSPPALEPHPEVSNPVVTAADVTDRESVKYVADPFVAREDDAYHLFFEVTYDSADPADSADVALATSEDGLDWEYRGVVLDDPYHLAYPSVFQWDGTWYMTPDKATYEYDGVPEFRIYRADSFPTDWSLAERPIVDEHVGDPTLVRWDGRWYLFSVEQEEVHGTRLHHAERLLDGDWTEHPASPIVTDPRNFRPAGRPIHDGDTFYLFLMDVARTYGDKVRCYEVTTLTPEAYEHREVARSPLLEASGSGWHADGMHHVDPVLPYTGDGEVVPVDGKDSEGTWSIGMYRVVDGASD